MPSNPARPSVSEVTLLLVAAGEGDVASSTALVQLLYRELHGIAASLLHHERPGHTLQPTALVHEAYLRLVGPQAVFENRAHFFGAASRCMRQILMKHAAARRAAKRGGDRPRVTLAEGNTPVAIGPAVDLLALDEALSRLEQLDERQCRVVEMRFFAGLSVDEVAVLLKASPRTIELDWQMARAWLARELGA
jgi:RNA polymerase sigma factor (TIGR02999 family)